MENFPECYLMLKKICKRYNINFEDVKELLPTGIKRKNYKKNIKNTEKLVTLKIQIENLDCLLDITGKLYSVAKPHKYLGQYQDSHVWWCSN